MEDIKLIDILSDDKLKEIKYKIIEKLLPEKVHINTQINQKERILLAKLETLISPFPDYQNKFLRKFLDMYYELGLSINREARKEVINLFKKELEEEIEKKKEII